MSEITEQFDTESVKEHKFLGKKIGKMDREELLAVISFLTEENEKLEQKYISSEKSKASLMGELTK